ncbi:alpha/beta hydrolase [Chryseolinea sp. T2]|uniref:alpha/beta fold hydrolase n=1 Tax=Chryseolinea sp. T2 TaxID=3129255 RepID=UPI0030781EEF
MYSRAIQLNNAVLSYDVQGFGSRALLLFHGAGQDRTVFSKLPAEITTTYRVYAFDLFFHGESQWNDGAISKTDWQQLVIKFCETEQVDKMAVLGYSIGARFALSIVESFSKQVSECFLVAPDGLVGNPWFKIATGTSFGRGVFTRLMKSPRGLHGLLQVGRRLGAMDPVTIRFIEHQLDNEKKRLRILQTWTSFRKLRFDLKQLGRIMDTSDIRLNVFLATQDRVIPEAAVRSFLKRLKSAHLEIIDSNHRRVLNEALLRIAQR